MLIIAVMVATVAVLAPLMVATYWVLNRALSARCPRCASKRTDLCIDLHLSEVWECRACRNRWRVYYRKGT